MIVTARKLARASPRRPRQAELRRAISTAYYAVFHAIANDAAELLVGAGALRTTSAWVQTYRALDHGFAKDACRRVKGLGLPPGVEACANAFIHLQEARHQADYDPQVRYTRADALSWVERAEAAIASLRGAPREDRRAFAIHLLLKRRP